MTCREKPQWHWLGGGAVEGLDSYLFSWELFLQVPSGYYLAGASLKGEEGKEKKSFQDAH